jgi:hypothetical protein
MNLGHHQVQPKIIFPYKIAKQYLDPGHEHAFGSAILVHWTWPMGYNKEIKNTKPGRQEKKHHHKRKLDFFNEQTGTR